MARRRRLSFVSATCAVLVLVLPSAAQATLRVEALAADHVVVSLGDAPSWLPLSGTPVGVTVFAGRRHGIRPGADNLFVSFQREGRSCARTPAADHAVPLLARNYFSAADLLSRQRGPFDPDGGAASGVYAATLGLTKLAAGRSTRACVWLGSDPNSAGLVDSQVIPLLNRTFAAAVSDLPQPGSAAPAYTLNAVGGAPFRLSATTTACGSRLADPAQEVAAGTPASEAVAPDPYPCTGDGTTFTFGSAVQALPSLTFTVAQAQEDSTVIVHAGGCALDAVTGAQPDEAIAYVTVDGCRVAGEQVAPQEAGLPRGTVLYASVDGGVADLAPAGTPVDLVLNG